MSLEAHIATEQGRPWLYITRPGPSQGQRYCVYDGPLDLSTKTRTRLEIDWAYEKTGMPRPDLYDAVRQFQHSGRKDSHANGLPVG